MLFCNLLLWSIILQTAVILQTLCYTATWKFFHNIYIFRHSKNLLFLHVWIFIVSTDYMWLSWNSLLTHIISLLSSHEIMSYLLAYGASKCNCILSKLHITWTPLTNRGWITCRAWITNHIHINLWDAIAHPCLSSNGRLAENHSC